MATKTIYFTVGGREEQAEFHLDIPSEDIKECFRSSAEAGPYDILKLYNYKGSIVNISSKLVENTLDQRYKLEVVAAHCGHCGKDFHGVDVEEIEKRLQSVENQVFVHHGNLPTDFIDLKNRVESFKEKLESVEHLSWLGLFKEIARGSPGPENAVEQSVPNMGSSTTPLDRRNLRRSHEHYQSVLEKFLKMGVTEPTEETLLQLRQPSFDNWQWEDAEMLFLLQQMYIDLGLVETFHIDLAVLQQFLYDVYKHYNQIPFHNFRHCFCVTQMMYGMICLSKVYTLIDQHEVLTMLTAALCHDLDHPGYNNAYQINARTELAIRYNDISPLENHHASIAFDILSKSNCNILHNLKPEIYKKVREGMIKAILATDMARHSEILNQFKGLLAKGFDFDNVEHRLLLLLIFVKTADISNEARPMEVAEPWLECLLEEFFNQSDLEKLEGLPVAPFMDREKVTKPSAQIGFIKFVLLPLMESVSELFPCLYDFLVKPVSAALDYYLQMGVSFEEERKKRDERKISTDGQVRKLSEEVLRKLSFENGRKISEEMKRKISDEQIERKISNGMVANGPMANGPVHVGKGQPHL